MSRLTRHVPVVNYRARFVLSRCFFTGRALQHPGQIGRRVCLFDAGLSKMEIFRAAEESPCAAAFGARPHRTKAGGVAAGLYRSKFAWIRLIKRRWNSDIFDWQPLGDRLAPRCHVIPLTSGCRSSTVRYRGNVSHSREVRF